MSWAGVPIRAPALPYALIHPSSWNMNSPKFGASLACFVP